MAGFDALVRGAVALADDLTSSLQVTVLHSAWTGQDAYGESTYATAVPRGALVEPQSRQIRAEPSGEMVNVTAKITFLRPVPPNGAASRVEPIDPRDHITLPDGSNAGVIVSVSGALADKSTGRGILSTVWIGA